VVAPRTEGALAPAPREVTPPPRGKVEPLRDIPALRKRERTWRDEVQERIRSRRQKRADSGLPLFDQPDVGASAEGPRVTPEAAPTPPEPLPPAHVRATPEEPRPASPSPQIGEAELADLPLRGQTDSEQDFGFVDEAAARTGRRRALPSLDDGALLPEAEEPAVELMPHPAASAPVERPAFAAERAQAAAVDAGLLAALFVLVIYFAGRAARANPLTLAPAWPWIAGYLCVLGLFYATYFTGTTGQTPGKILTGLRVVDVGGRPPGYLRAMARAVAGALGLALAGLGLLPMAFDPARRAVHDRLLHTRVVRR
jgi:uncharacterized RDD family membrane protein YckC